MFKVGEKVRCITKGQPGGVVLWSNRNETEVLVGYSAVVFDNGLLEAVTDTIPIFVQGQLVRHMHRNSIRGYVFRCGKEKTTIMVRMGWEDSLAVFYTNHLEPVKSKKRNKKKNSKGSRGRSSILTSTLKTDLVLPGVFVDASMGAGGKNPRIAAVLIGYHGKQLYYAVENVQCKNNNAAEAHAIRLGIEIRVNDSWPIYSDSYGQGKNFPGCNVVWIPRTKNKVADKLIWANMG